MSGSGNFLELNHHDEWLKPMAGATYFVVFQDGTVRAGVLDASGYARLEGVPDCPGKAYYPGAATAALEPRPEDIAELWRFLDDEERRALEATLRAGAPS